MIWQYERNVLGIFFFTAAQVFTIAISGFKTPLNKNEW